MCSSLSETPSPLLWANIEAEMKADLQQSQVDFNNLSDKEKKAREQDRSDLAARMESSFNSSQNAIQKKS